MSALTIYVLEERNNPTDEWHQYQRYTNLLTARREVTELLNRRAKRAEWTGRPSLYEYRLAEYQLTRHHYPPTPDWKVEQIADGEEG